GEHGGEHGGALVHRLGVRRDAVRQPRAIREMVAPQLGEELEDPDPLRPRAARLPGGPIGGLSGVHRRPPDGGASEVPVFPRRGALGPEATEPATVVEHCARLAGPVPQAPGGNWRALIRGYPSSGARRQPSGQLPDAKPQAVTSGKCAGVLLWPLWPVNRLRLGVWQLLCGLSTASLSSCQTP